MDPSTFIPPVPPPMPQTMPLGPTGQYIPPDPTIVPGAWGTNGKFVACHWCQGCFTYRIVRSVAGRSAARAEMRLRQVLNIEQDPVPCPSCGCYQPDMLILVKRAYR